MQLMTSVLRHYAKAFDENSCFGEIDSPKLSLELQISARNRAGDHQKDHLCLIFIRSKT